MKTKAEQRIEIAKDVLKWIKTDKLKVLSLNTYFVPKTNARYCGKQLKDVLPKIKKCEVCALGGLFYAHIMRYNEFEIDKWGVSNVGSRTDIVYKLGMFSLGELTHIENSFESNNFYRNNHNIETDTEALTHIMNNIITNKGTFKP